MALIDDLRRFVAPIQRKISCLLGRAVLLAVANEEMMQKLRLSVIAGETITGIERVQEYGFETFPIPGAEAVAIFFGGDRGHGIVVSVGDRRYRLTDLVEGEVALYTHEDAEEGGHRIHLKAGQITDMKGIDLNITQTGDLTITIGGNEVKSVDGNSTVTIGGNATVNISGTADVTAGGKVTLTGDLVDVNGGGTMAGVINGLSMCHFTGGPHADVSLTTRTSK